MLSDPNAPLPDPTPADGEEWTPEKGLVRAAIHTGVAAAVLAALLFPAAWFAPPLILQVYIRAFLALVVAWVLFEVGQRAAGMVGPHVTAIVLAASVLALFSNHVVFAVHGVPTGRGLVAGIGWLSPRALVLHNGSAAVGLIACALIRHNGGGDLNTLVSIFTGRVGGTWR